MAKATPPADIDGYITQFPSDVQTVLRDVRAAIRRGAPDGEEAISYRTAGIRRHGILVYFAAWKTHIDL